MYKFCFPLQTSVVVVLIVLYKLSLRYHQLLKTSCLLKVETTRFLEFDFDFWYHLWDFRICIHTAYFISHCFYWSGIINLRLKVKEMCILSSRLRLWALFTSNFKSFSWPYSVIPKLAVTAICDHQTMNYFPQSYISPIN